MLDGVKGPKEFTDKNQVSFITFNYDHLLERWLLRRIKYSFGLDDMSALEVLSAIPIQHVYGTLGKFPNSALPNPPPWVQASKSIRTIFDTEKDEAVLSRAKANLASAHSICLLGFGFHRENIELLDLVGHTIACKGLVAASCYGINDVEWERVTRPFDGADVRKSHYTHKCLETLRNLPIF